MANKILVEENWQERIRDRLGVDSAYLPDSAIEQKDIIVVAEANIISQIPSYETLVGDSRVYLESVVVLECCILLCPSMSARLPKKQTGPHAGHEIYVNWDNKKAEFLVDRDDLVGKILALDSPESIGPGLKTFGATFPLRKW